MHLETLRSLKQWRRSSAHVWHRRPCRLNCGGLCCFCCAGGRGHCFVKADCCQRPVSSAVTQLSRRRGINFTGREDVPSGALDLQKVGKSAFWWVICAHLSAHPLTCELLGNCKSVASLIENIKNTSIKHRSIFTNLLLSHQCNMTLLHRYIKKKLIKRMSSANYGLFMSWWRDWLPQCSASLHKPQGQAEKKTHFQLYCWFMSLKSRIVVFPFWLETTLICRIQTSTSFFMPYYFTFCLRLISARLWFRHACESHLQQPKYWLALLKRSIDLK